MAVIAGTVVGSAIVPSDTADQYPVVDTFYALGGAREVPTTAARNATTQLRARAGMLVFCASTGITYRLKAGYGNPIVDADWEVAIPSGGGGGLSGSGVAGQVTIWTGASSVGGDTAFIFDTTNKWLKVGSALGTVDSPLHVRSNTANIFRLEGGTTFPLYLNAKNASADDIARIVFSTVANRGGVIDLYTKVADNNQATAATFNLRVDSAGQVGLKTTSPQTLLDINGGISWRRGTDYSTIGTQNDVVLGSNSLVRYTGAGAATFTGIAGGNDGKVITLINVSGSNLVLNNNDAGSAAANRIITGTGANFTISNGASILLQYDSSDSLWHITGASPFSGGGTIGGSIANTQIAFGTAANTIGGSNDITWDDVAKQLLANGTIYSTGTTGATPVAGAGTRLMWIPSLSAFRAGVVTGTQWDAANIGANSAAFGTDNLGVGPSSFLTGVGGTIAAAATGSAIVGSLTSTISGASLYSFVGGGSNNLISASPSSMILGDGCTIVSSSYSLATGQNMNITGQNCFGFNGTISPATLTDNNTFGIFHSTQLLKTHSNYTDSGSRDETYTFTTTNNVQQILYAKTLKNNTAYLYSFDILVRRSDLGPSNARFSRKFLVYREAGGGATLGAAVVTPWADEQLNMTPAIFVLVNVNVNDVRILITGQSNSTLEWHAKVRYEQITTSA